MQPKNAEEFQKRFATNQHISGWHRDVATHIPCGFCGAAEWLVVKVTDFEHEAMSKGGVCADCGRGVRAIVTRNAGGVSFELVQFCGDDPPDWMPKPWPRRV